MPREDNVEIGAHHRERIEGEETADENGSETTMFRAPIRESR